MLSTVETPVYSLNVIPETGCYLLQTERREQALFYRLAKTPPSPPTPGRAPTGFLPSYSGKPDLERLSDQA